MNKELENRIDRLTAQVDTLNMALISLLAQEMKPSTHARIAQSVEQLKEKLIANRLASNEASDAYMDELNKSFEKLQQYIEITAQQIKR